MNQKEEDIIVRLKSRVESQAALIVELEQVVSQYLFSESLGLAEYIPRVVLDEIRAVLEFGDEKHPGEEWRRQRMCDHVSHANEHINAARHIVLGGARLRYDFLDAETHRLHLAHAICRLMFAAALELEVKP